MTVQIRRTALMLFGTLFALVGIAGVARAQADKPFDPADPATLSPDSPNSIVLPNSGSTSSSATAWSITNNGTGGAGIYVLNNKNSNNSALEARTYSTATNATALTAQAMGTSGGATSAAVRGINRNTTAGGYGVYGQHVGGGSGVYGLANGAGGRGVLGTAAGSAGRGVQGNASSSTGYGGYFINTTTSGAATGLYGESKASGGYGVRGVSPYFGVYGSGGYAGVMGTSASFGVYGSSDFTGVFGEGDSAGVAGSTSNADGVAGRFVNLGGTFSTAVRGLTGNATDDFIYNNLFTNAAGEFTGYTGVIGASNIGGTGVNGFSQRGGTAGLFTVKDDNTGSYRPYGVYSTANARAGYPTGVYASATDNSTGRPIGLEAKAFGANSDKVYGIFASAGSGKQGAEEWAGYFAESVFVNGTCCHAAQLSTRIDSPLDPSGKYLDQLGVVSGERLGMFNGNVTLDARGQARVTLPGWVEATYGDFRYQLTTVGGAALVYVADELKGGQFVIDGGKAGLKVSWQVSGVRKDAYAAAHPFQPESAKPADEQGKYLYAIEAGKAENLGLNYIPSEQKPDR